MQKTGKPGQNQYVAARNRIEFPSERLKAPRLCPVPGPNIRKNCFESHRQLYSQG
jgi:hypothetical protein